MALPIVEGLVVVEKLGAGSYATVYKGYKKGSLRECVAVKCIERSSLKGSAVDNLITEIRLLKSLTHPHIVTMKDFIWDDKNIYIIMEYCNYGDLLKYVKREKGIDEKLCRRLLRQLALALQLLREKGVVHMDLKPQNLLLHKTLEGKIILKVGDFGFAQYMSEETRAKNMRGSPLYMAPEVFSLGMQIKSGQNSVGYDASVDLWSVGIILYECLFGRAPYSSNTYKELVNKILSHKVIEIPASPRLSEDCKDLLKRLLQHDPKQRISYEDFFQHPFLDMKHVPSPENYKKAVELVQQAIDKDASSDYEAAYHLYCESLRYFVPIVIEEYGTEANNTLREKVNGYVKRAEELKLFTVGGVHPESPSSSGEFKQSGGTNNECSPEVPARKAKTSRNNYAKSDKIKSVLDAGGKGINSNNSDLASEFSKGVAVSETIRKRNITAVQSDTTVIHNMASENCNASSVSEELPYIEKSDYLTAKAQFDKLYGLCSSTAQLITGLDVGRSAEMYVRDGRLEEALSLYQSAISVLLKGCQSEPLGMRKMMLRNKIEEWLKEAESIKSLLESREMQQQQMIAEDLYKEQCSIQ